VILNIVQSLCTTVQSLCIAVQSLCTTVQSLCIAVQSLCTTVQSLCTTVQSLCITVQSLCIAVQSLCIAVQSLCTTVQSLCTTVQSLCIAVQSLCTTVQSLCTAVQSLCTTVQSLCIAVQWLCTAVQSDNQENIDIATEIGDLVEGEELLPKHRGRGWGRNCNLRSHLTYLFGRLYGQTDRQTDSRRRSCATESSRPLGWPEQLCCRATANLTTVNELSVMSVPCMTAVISAVLYDCCHLSCVVWLLSSQLCCMTAVISAVLSSLLVWAAQNYI